MAHDVFISYSHLDKPTADAACATLESRGIRCWIAPRDVLPGDEYASALVNAIHSSRMLVLVFSSGANQSPQVLREVERAVSKGLPILPLRIEDVTPSPAMEYYISSRHWLDALTTPLEQHLVQLADTVGLLLARSPGGAPASAPASAVRPVPPPVVEERETATAEPAPPPGSRAPPGAARVPPAAEPEPQPSPKPRPEPAPAHSSATERPPARAADPALALRGRVALAGIVVIAILGASSAIWPRLSYMFGWSSTNVMALSALRLVSFAAGFFAGGTLLLKRSPRRIATLAGVLYGLGTLAAGLALTGPAAVFLFSLVLACLAGFGTGLGFVVVIATAIGWFPDRRGTLAGLAIAALVISPLPGELLVEYFGLRSLMLIGLLALLLVPLAARALQGPPGTGPFAPREAAGQPRIALWALLFLNTVAGALVSWSLLAGMRSEDFVRTRYAFAFALCLGLGAMILGALSDRLGRRRVLLVALVAQLLVLVTVPLLFAAAVPLLLLFMLANGGGFSVASAIMADSVGTPELGPAFGLLLTAWSMALLATGAVGGLAGERGLPWLLAAALPCIALVTAWRLPLSRSPARV